MAGQTIDFVSPGTNGIPDTTVALPVDAGGNVNVAGLRPKFFPRKLLESGQAQVFRPKVGPNVQIVVHGLNVVANHWLAMDELIPGAMWTIFNEGGGQMVKAGRRTVPIDSGATFRSIHHFMTTMPNAVMVSVGPTTFYAPFIEYGMGGHADIGPRPFMTKALWEVLPSMVLALHELTLLAKAGASYRFGTPEYAEGLNGLLSKWRRHLYTIEKELGDTAFIGPIGFNLGGGLFRKTTLGLARILGDVQSIVGRAVGGRITRRLTGRVTGRLIGVGSRTIFVNKSYTTQITGGQRAYNRVAGKAMTRYVDQSRFIRGLG